MKRLALLAAAALSLLTVFSCTKEQDILTLDSTSYTVSNAGAVQTIAFTASTAWTIASDSDWITLDKSSGAAGTVSVKMTVAPNTTYQDRTGKITLTMGSKTTVFTVNQTQEATYASAIVVNIDSKEQDFAIEVATNISYTVTVPDDCKDWISVVQTKAAPEEGRIILHVTANAGIAPRSGYFVVSTDKYSQTYNLVQSAEYTPASEATASYLKNKQYIFDEESYSYTTFGQFAVVLKTEDGDEITLVLNNAREDADGNDLKIGSELIAGTYAVDASATHEDKTFSIKSTDGHEKYYTTLVSAGKEIAIEDGEINVEKAEDGTYTITAILVDAAEAQHRYSYQGKITVTDDSFGALVEDAPSFMNTYYTYFTTKANQWNVNIIASDAAKAGDPYVSYMTFTLYGQAGDGIDGTEIPEGTFTFAEPENDETLSWATGTLKAQPNTFTLSANTLAQDGVDVDPEKGGTIKITKRANGNYDFEINATLRRKEYNEETWEEEVKETFAYSAKFEDVYVPAATQGLTPNPDGDHVASTAMTSQYVALWFGDALNTNSNLFVIGFNNVDYDYTIYLGLNAAGTWEFTKNFANRYCNTPFTFGKYEFSETAAAGTLQPIKMSTSVYCFVKNGYTGTTMKVVGGSVTLSANTITYDLKVKTDAGDTYSFTGSHAAELYYARDYTSRAKLISLYSIE